MAVFCSLMMFSGTMWSTSVSLLVRPVMSNFRSVKIWFTCSPQKHYKKIIFPAQQKTKSFFHHTFFHLVCGFIWLSNVMYVLLKSLYLNPSYRLWIISSFRIYQLCQHYKTNNNQNLKPPTANVFCLFNFHVPWNKY